MIKLRPHHLLCTQGYSGKGYDNDFVINMNQIVAELRNNSNATVELVFNTDSLCGCCPNKLGENLCDTQAKVAGYDRKTVECFHLEEKEYNYQEITKFIRDHMTEEKLAYICEDCSWYPISACRRKLIPGYSEENKS